MRPTRSLGGWHTFESLEGGLLESFSVIGVGDLNEGMGTLAKSFAEQISDTELGGHVMYVRAAGHDSRA